MTLSQGRKLLLEGGERFFILFLLSLGNLRIQLAKQEGVALFAKEIERLLGLPLNLAGKLGRLTFEERQQALRVVSKGIIQPGDDLERLKLPWNPLVPENGEQRSIPGVKHIVFGHKWQHVSADRAVAEEERQQVILMGCPGSRGLCFWPPRRLCSTLKGRAMHLGAYDALVDPEALGE